MAKFKDIINNQQPEETDKPEMETLPTGTTKIDTENIVNVEEKTYEFDDRKVKRYIYTLKSGRKLIIPQSVHTAISNVTKKTDITTFEIEKTGTGLQTKYNVTPIK